jgi:hypothetical protein
MYRISNRKQSAHKNASGETDETLPVFPPQLFYSTPTCHNLFSPPAQPNLSKTWQHTTKFHLTKRRYETIGHKYVFAYKFLPYKNADV